MSIAATPSDDGGLRIEVAPDITLAGDYPGRKEGDMVTRLGDGVGIKIMDSSLVCHPKLVDHFQRDIRRLPAFVASMWQATRNLIQFNKEVGSPTVDQLTAHPPPRTRFNHSLSARRNFTTRQIPLADIKAVGKKLGGTVNDVVLALAAGAVRSYLLFHDDLPDEALQADQRPVDAP